MFNLLPFQKRDLFDLHTEILSSKRNKELVRDLSAINTEIRAQYDAFSTHSLANTLEGITSLNTSDKNKLNLRALYSIKNKIIQEIKKDVTTNGRGRTVAECQYCTINSVSSMDHIMPKSGFPEFSVNAQNLFPACLECNNYKAEVWLRGGERQFLNLYLDILPDSQYLFVDTDYQNEVFNVRFYLENRESIDENLFGLIVRHYENLHLFKRFSDASNTIATTLRSTLISLHEPMSIGEVQSFVKKVAKENKEYFGNNYWKTILQIELVNNEEFLRASNIVD